MSEQLLELLKLGMLALLYLFFVRVMWAVWTELRAPAAERVSVAGAATKIARPSGARGRERQPLEPARVLRVVEPPDRAGLEFSLGPELSIGRAQDSVIVLDDTYVSGHHAVVRAEGDGFRLDDLGSTNGTIHNGRPVTTSVPVARGDRIQIGTTVLEVV